VTVAADRARVQLSIKFVFRAVRYLPAVAGGCTMALAVASPAHPWLAWISFAPLVIAVRFLRPRKAGYCGAVWGSSLFLFSTLFDNTVISPSLTGFVMLTTIPAVYTYLGAFFTRRFGFSPLAIALGWIVVVLALEPAGLSHGLVPVEHGHNRFLQMVAGSLGYGFVAFLIVYVNALLLSLAEAICVRGAALRLLKGCAVAPRLPETDMPACLRNQYLLPLQPRGPPLAG